MVQPGRDRVGTTGPKHACDKAWARSNNALGAHMTRPGRVHNKNVHVTEELCRDRDFSVVTRHDLVSELRYMNNL